MHNQVLGSVENQIVMHKQDSRDVMKHNLNAAIMQNHKKALELSKGLANRDSNLAM